MLKKHITKSNGILLLFLFTTISLLSHNHMRIISILWGILGLVEIKKNGYKKMKFESPILIYLIGLFFSLINAINFEISIKEIYRQLFPFFIIFGLSQIRIEKNKKKMILDYSIKFLIILYFIYVVLQKNGILYSKYGPNKLIPFNLSGVGFGYIMGIICIYYYVNILKNKYQKKNLFYIFPLIVVLLLNNTRGVWLGLFITIFLVYYLQIKNKYKGILIGSGIIGIFIFLLKLLKNNLYVKRIYSIVNTKTDGSNLGRLQAWNIAWQRVKERPILGWGYKPRLSYDTVAAGRLDHPHNEYLGYLVGTGVVGLIGYLYMMFYILYISFKRKDNIYWLNMFGIIIFTLVYGGVELLMQVSNSLYIMLFMLGIAINSTIENEGKINEKS